MINAAIQLALPSHIPVPCKPQQVMKAVIGHLMAQGVNRHKTGANTSHLRKYVINKNHPLPENIHIYCWLYPYPPQVLIRDMVVMMPSQQVFGWLLKFYPFAFWVTFDAKHPVTRNYNIVNMDPYRNVGYDYEANILLPLQNFPPEWWPESPSGREVLAVVFGQEAIITV